MADPLFGVTWKLDKPASIFSLGTGPDNETRDYKEIPKGYSLSVKGTHAGVPYTWSYTALYDGADHPVTGRSDVDAIAAYKVDDRVTLGIFKKNGQDVALYAQVVAQDNKGLRVLTSGKDAKGAAYFDALTYSK